MRSVWKTIGVIIFCVLLALPSIAQAKLVEDVEIRGYRKVSLEEIKKRIRTEPGKTFNANLAVKDFDRLMRMEAFDPLQSSLIIRNSPRGGKIVVFELKEKP